MTGTAHAVPVCHRATVEIFLAARHWARGQSHDAHALDRGAF